MRTAFIFTLLLSLSLTGMAQKKNKSVEEPEKKQEVSQNTTTEYQLQKSIAMMALKYNDAMVAKQALYNMIALSPERTDLIDSLALLYFQIGSYTECILVAREILEKQPDKTSILEVKAISEQNLGLAKMALEDYEKLYPATKNIFHLYQIATLQYDLKRFGECDVTIQRLMADEKLKESKIKIFLGQGQSQEVPMEAGIYNMQGMLLLNINKEVEAKERFNKALELAPEFVLPKNNLAALEKSKEDK